MNKFDLFTTDEYSLLVRLVLAHLLSDFVFQTKKMVEGKAWNSFGMFSHIAVTMLAVLILTGNIPMTLFIGVTHYLIDLTKGYLTKKYPQKSFQIFFADQAAHIAVIVFIWLASLGKLTALGVSVKDILNDFKFMLLLSGYVFCIWPCSYIVGFAVQNLLNGHNNNTPQQNEKIENGGRWIGQFERVIIFTFVLLYQYEAIGFLITGKSIIRFADRDHVKSEYVLAGTMLSYALAIVPGVLINWLLT